MEQIQLEILPKNTTQLQLASVRDFMSELQYDWCEPTKSFISLHPVNKGRVVLSLRTAVLLHNGNYHDWGGGYFREPFADVPEEFYMQAQLAKIVYVASLQLSKHAGILTQKHYVRFSETENGDLFKKKFM
jgi:hypothetical protein